MLIFIYGDIRRQFLEVLNEIKSAEGNKKSTAEGGVKLSLSEMGFEEFNRETSNNIKMRQGIIINSVSDLEEHIEKALNRKEKVNLYVGAISEDVKKKIENDIDTKIFKDKQYAFVVSYDDKIHIAEHFGENAQNIAREVVKLYDIIKNYDAVGFEITNKGVKKLIFDKSYSDYDYRTVEIASNKKATLDLVTLYVTKNNIKNRSQSVPPAAKNGSQWGSASNNNIPQNDNVVNSYDMQSSEKKFSYAGVKAKTSDVTTLDQAQRLEDIGKEDTEESTTSIKEQLKNNTEMLNSMNIVGRLNENKVFYNKQGIVTWIVDKLKNTRDTIQRKNFGDIVFDIKRIRNGLRYFKTNEERLALALVPDVLRKGVEIGYHSEHKDRIYDTFTFAAPIEINGVRGNMAVVVRASEKNYYKVHRLLLPDGSQFVFKKKEIFLKGRAELIKAQACRQQKISL